MRAAGGRRRGRITPSGVGIGVVAGDGRSGEQASRRTLALEFRADNGPDLLDRMAGESQDEGTGVGGRDPAGGEGRKGIEVNGATEDNHNDITT